MTGTCKRCGFKGDVSRLTPKAIACFDCAPQLLYKISITVTDSIELTAGELREILTWPEGTGPVRDGDIVEACSVPGRKAYEVHWTDRRGVSHTLFSLGPEEWEEIRKIRTEKRQASGLCVSCGALAAAANHVQCEACSAAARRLTVRRRKLVTRRAKRRSTTRGVDPVWPAQNAMQKRGTC